MMDMYINELIANDYWITTRIKAELKETTSSTDNGLIQLKHLTTAAKIVGGVCLVSTISLIFEIIYSYVKGRLAHDI